MRVFVGLRVVLALLMAVILPLEQAHCAVSMAEPSEPTAAHAAHHDDEDADSHPESAGNPASPTDPCCCDILQLPCATSPASITVDTPTVVPTLLAVESTHAVTAAERGVCVQPVADAHSGSPPDPSADPQSPRSPPQSA